MMSQQNSGFFIKLNLSDFKIQRVEQDAKKEFHIYGECTADSTHCTRCHSRLTQIHAYADEVSIEHLTIFDQKVWLHVKWPRFYCPQCDKRIQFHPEWLGKTGKMTVALENFLLRQLVHSDIKDVAAKFRISEKTLEGLLERRIKTTVDWQEYDLRVIGIDEIALKKGHGNYLTIVSDLSIFKKVKIITVIRGNSEADVLPFLKRIPRPKMAKIEAICVDMGTGYQSAFKTWLSKEDFERLVTIDRFHVARLLGTKVDKIRKEEIRRLKKSFKHNPQVLMVLEGSQWLFRKHEKDLSSEEFLKLENLFLFSPELKIAYKLKEDFFKIFETGYSVPEAKKKVDQWCKRAELSQHQPIKVFVNTYREHEVTILNYFKWRYSSGAVEGMNNKVKLIKRRGFGYTNIEHFIRRLLLDFNYAGLFLPELSAF